MPNIRNRHTAPLVSISKPPYTFLRKNGCTRQNSLYAAESWSRLHDPILG